VFIFVWKPKAAYTTAYFKQFNIDGKNLNFPENFMNFHVLKHIYIGKCHTVYSDL